MCPFGMLVAVVQIQRTVLTRAKIPIGSPLPDGNGIITAPEIIFLLVNLRTCLVPNLAVHAWSTKYR